jgi:hypothetical protein
LTTHLSVRLCWHDSGWNGRICKDPEKNKFCNFLDYIRENRDDKFMEFETKEANKEKHLSEFDCNSVKVPCRGEICVFSKKGYDVGFEHPLKVKGIPGYDLDPTLIEGAPFSFYPAPYRWMNVDNYNSIREKENLALRDLSNEDLYYPSGRKKNWIDDVRLQGPLLRCFWSKPEENKSFVVFYVNSTPAVEDTKRVVVGIGRLKKIFKQTFYGKSAERPGPNYVWQRRLTHNFPKEGFRLPYQEYIEQGVDPKDISLVIPPEYENEFKYVIEHVTDGAMLFLCERLSKTVEQIQDDISKGRVKLGGNWKKHHAWLQRTIEELWENRGKYPGIGSVLRFLGFSRGVTYHSEVLIPMEKENEDILEHVLGILDGDKKPEKGYQKDFEDSKRKWNAYSKDETKRNLLKLLMKLEISEDQVDRIIKEDRRFKSGIRFDGRAIVDNPYLIAENDKGLYEENEKISSERISLDTIDQAMVPLFYSPEKYQLDDDRRIRAIMIEELRKASEEGNTFLSMKKIVERVRERFLGERQCNPDLYLIKANKSFYEKRLEFLGENDEFVALKEIRDHEIVVSRTIKEMVGVTYDEEAPNWEAIMDQRFGDVFDSPLGYELEQRSRNEKMKALNTIYANKFLALTGRAGTGKTEVLTILIEGLIRRVGLASKDLLVLAPTGKARVRIKKNLRELGLENVQPKTIHQHLNQYDWLDENFELKSTGGRKKAVSTVIIDESSMLPVDLFATLIKSIELSRVKRFVMIGDPNQLPPIGPGRPFDDIVKWLAENKETSIHIADLKARVRHGVKGKESVSLRLADGFLRDFKSKDIEEVYSIIGKGNLDENDDLHFYSWTDHNDLLAKLDHVMEEIGIADHDSYLKSVGIIDHDASQCESWQVLSPVKYKEVSGTIPLNSYLQDKFLGDNLARWRTQGYYDRGKRYPKPFGKTKDIIHHDKVIQIRNTRKLKCFPNKREPYVANGEIGTARWTFGYGRLRHVMNVSFSDQPEFSYSYHRGEHERSVEMNLELAYAITIHKSQGSDFDNVILVIPQRAFNISMEMMYTALTRFKERTYLLVQDGLETLERYRHVSSSETDRRNTFLFKIAVGEDVEDIPYAEYRIHTTKNGFLVRSKSEVIIANELINAGIPLTEDSYEEKLYSKDDPYEYKLPDFTFEHKGKKYYWEHFGMLAMESYRKSTEAKLKWYEDNGYMPNLITSKDGLDGSINSQQIDAIIEAKLGLKTSPKLRLEDLEEGVDVEFKSSIAWDYKNNRKNRDLEFVIAKTISAFMNTEGGLVVIGIDDEKNVLGIENDLKLLKKPDEDGFQLKITEVVSNYIGKEFAQLVQCSFEEKENKKIALVHVKRSVDEPTHATRNNEPKFFIRTNNSTQQLNMKESLKYIKKHWPGYI